MLLEEMSLFIHIMILKMNTKKIIVNKKWFSGLQGSIYSGRFIFCVYWYILIALIIFPIVLWILLGLEWLFLS